LPVTNNEEELENQDFAEPSGEIEAKSYDNFDFDTNSDQSSLENPADFSDENADDKAQDLEEVSSDEALANEVSEETEESIELSEESNEPAQTSQEENPGQVEVDGDFSEERIPGVIYYDATSLDEGLENLRNDTTELKELHNEQTELKSENYYAENTGGYFVKKQNKINYYRNNKLVKNANIKVEDRIYRADKSGTITNPKNKWLNIGSDIYYNNSKGNILKGINEINKVKFYFSNEGALERNKKLITQGAYYELDNAGRMKTVNNRWVNVNNNIYRTLGNGKIAKGITKINDKDFFFDKEGKLQTNKKLILADKYYEVNPMGIVTNPKNKWVAVDGVSYRTKADGSLTRGIAEINGNTYIFNYKTGAMITGRPSITNGLYFSIDDKGIATLVKDDWVTYEGKTFHTNNAG